MKTLQKGQLYYLIILQPWIERIAFVLLVVAVVLTFIGIPAQELLMVAMATLSIAFFLNIRIPFETERPGDASWGFREMLTYLVLPKIMWISASVSVIGILFHILGLKGALEMLFIGGTSLFFAIGIFGILLLTGSEDLKIYQRILLRIIPVAIIAIYLFLAANWRT